MIKGRPIFVAGVAIILLSVGGFFFRDRIAGFFRVKSVEYKTPDVSKPTIVGGELVLPKVYTGGVLESKDRIGVVSAFLVGVSDEKTQQLVGIRILGEIANLSDKIVNEISPVIRFYDDKDKLIAQKVAKITPGFNFFSFKPAENTIYDILVEDPPKADKLEIIINSAGFEKIPSTERLKITSSKMEVKTAKYQSQADSGQQIADSEQSTDSGEATISATSVTTPEVSEVEYYTLSGSVVNNLVDAVSDMTVYAWVKNAEGKVFSFARQDFKGDLVSSKKKVEFKINLLPFKMEEKMDKFEVAAFGKRYKL